MYSNDKLSKDNEKRAGNQIKQKTLASSPNEVNKAGIGIFKEGIEEEKE